LSGVGSTTRCGGIGTSGCSTRAYGSLFCQLPKAACSAALTAGTSMSPAAPNSPCAAL
jgi:hypothetical protein